MLSQATGCHIMRTGRHGPPQGQTLGVMDDGHRDERKAATCYGWRNEIRSAGLRSFRAEPDTVRMGDAITDTRCRTGLTAATAGATAAAAGRARGSSGGA